MTNATVYASPRMALSDREALIHAGLEAAFTAAGDIDIRPMGSCDHKAKGAAHGLMRANEAGPVVALGRAAHLALPDIEKRTLLTEDLACGATADEDLEAEIAALIWSSVNTVRIVALGQPAWQATQLLPFAERLFHQVPPLRMPPADLARGVLVISHGEGTRSAALIAALIRAQIEARCTDGSDTDLHGTKQHGWSDAAPIHVHVGDHTLAAQGLRLVDSWYSGRLVVQLDDKRRASTTAAPCGLLTVEDNENGLICGTPDAAVAACRDLLEDPVLRRKLITGGQCAVAPFLKAWRVIAEDLLA